MLRLRKRRRQSQKSAGMESSVGAANSAGGRKRKRTEFQMKRRLMRRPTKLTKLHMERRMMTTNVQHGKNESARHEYERMLDPAFWKKVVAGEAANTGREA